MSVVGIGIISKRGERKYTPLEIRIKAYNDAIELKKQGVKCKEIQRRLCEKYGKQISIRNIYYWIDGKHYPFGRINKFNEEPSRELSYVIGVILSDGYKYFDNNTHYYLWLAVKDKEFAEEFGRCLAKVLGREEPYKPFWNAKQKQWIVAVCSIQLFKFLDKPFEELKPYIEYSKETIASFLRALFDGDGSIHVKIRGRKRGRALWLYNTNKELLIYAKYLLKKYFDIDASGPHLATRKGSIMYFPNGKITKTTQDYYYIYIPTRSLLNFYKHIGFSIKRKQRDLIKAIQ
jgi:intein-encoded DNA endonuclease-like protein